LVLGRDIPDFEAEKKQKEPQKRKLKFLKSDVK